MAGRLRKALVGSLCARKRRPTLTWVISTRLMRGFSMEAIINLQSLLISSDSAKYNVQSEDVSIQLGDGSAQYALEECPSEECPSGSWVKDLAPTRYSTQALCKAEPGWVRKR
ncbi:hypothetical protein ASPFODRAFT_213087 [Aspergillus luchuensis CBS 106.47]|uniref:Uncharacterized protein n=1 Tax=Aspergillus luchuensis (strain CBS 106.47) TaxID=1137211 RepID=A0A1M3SZ47_ASPLC|nr:hypothetical protein ASPFODRAFT_213087 [Aspergillus luchuensis CBS 106.47]